MPQLSFKARLHSVKPAFSEIHRVLERNRFCVSFYGWPHTDLFIGAYRAAGFRIVGHLVFCCFVGVVSFQTRIARLDYTGMLVRLYFQLVPEASLVICS